MAIDFRIKDFFYPADIWRLRHALERTQWLSAPELCAYQESLLQKVIHQANVRVPYYRERFASLDFESSKFRGLEDLKKLPILRKQVVREQGFRLLAEDARKYNPRSCRTSGTTGQPVTIYQDKGANVLEFVYYWRHWNWAGYRIGNSFAELNTSFFLKGPHLNRSVSHYQPLLRRLLLNSCMVSVDSARSIGSAIRRHRPLFLKGLASTLYSLAWSLSEAQVEPLQFKAVFSTGEVLTGLQRKLISEVLKAPVLDSFGHMERTVAVSECLSGGLHINSDYGVLELDNLRPSGDPETVVGSVLGTSLHNMAMPLIRYEVGDSVEVPKTQTICPCGRTLPLVKKIHGRTEDTILTPDGRFITSAYVLPEFVSGIRAIQFIQESTDQLEVRLVSGPGWQQEQEEKLLYYTRKLMGPGMRIRLNQVSPDRLQRDATGKLRVVIAKDHREL